jgi:hypothetical protein
MAVDSTGTTIPSGLDVYPPIAGGGGGGGGSVTSVTAGDESIIIGGTATDPTVRANTTKTAVASQALTGGDWVTVYDNAGTPTVRKADWTLGQAGECNGYVAANVANGGTATVFISGINAHVSGMVTGDVWLAGTGLGTNTAPASTAGNISQRIGRALSATAVGIEFEPAMLISTPSTPSSGGVMQSQEFTASGTFTVPTGVKAVWLTMVGGGGGGYGTGATAAAGSGGGAGELLEGQLVPTVPGAAITVTVGTGGTGGASGAHVGVDGGTTSFGPVWKVLGGGGGQGTSAGPAGAGGGIRGAAGGVSGGGAGILGTAETPTAFGGSSGGVGSAGGTGGAGGGSAGLLAGGAGGVLASAKAGGGGGAATRWGVGGAGGNGEVAGSNAPAGSYGAGGGGAGGSATGKAGGNGLDGYVLVVWVG